jgi:hypothetical protein
LLDVQGAAMACENSLVPYLPIGHDFSEPVLPVDQAHDALIRNVPRLAVFAGASA